MKKPYLVLIVDDSAFMRKMISEIISDHPDFEVIYAAKNGKEAVEKARELKPDVITMDVEMPVMDGLDALKLIMRENPIPVIMLSSVTNESAQETLTALDIGAVDFIQKPSGSISFDLYKIKCMIHEKLQIAIQTKPKALLTSGDTDKGRMERFVRPTPKHSMRKNKPSAKFQHVVAVGTSTGGPRALQQFITMIPSDFPAPLLIVQHMPPKFTTSLAERLDLLANIPVVEAEDGMIVQAGQAYLAPGGWHMMLSKDVNEAFCIRLSKTDPRNGHRPSVNVLFESLLPFSELNRHTVIMTGMGSDGAEAMKALADEKAGITIAQSMETCVVYGMPRSAIELGAVDHVLPLEDMADKVIEIVNKH